ncbi:hypothetical protein D3C72_1301010 [compost metagenome]
MQGPVHAHGLQTVRDGGVAAAFVDRPFGIGVDLCDRVRLAEAGNGFGCLAPVVDGQQLERNAQPGQVLGQLAQVAQPEVHLRGRIAMQAPLAGRRQEERGDGAGFGGRGQGGVVVHAQVGAQPEQRIHEGLQGRGAGARSGGWPARLGFYPEPGQRPGQRGLEDDVKTTRRCDGCCSATRRAGLLAGGEPSGRSGGPRPFADGQTMKHAGASGVLTRVGPRHVMAVNDESRQTLWEI